MPGEVENLTKKGAQANPNGRPTRHKPIAEAMKHLLTGGHVKMIGKAYTIDLPPNPTPAHYIARRAIFDALNGDSQALKTVLERTEGKVAQPIIGSDDPSEPAVKLTRDAISIKEAARVLGNILLTAERNAAKERQE